MDREGEILEVRLGQQKFMDQHPDNISPAEGERFLFVFALKNDIRGATSFDDLTIYSQKSYIDLSRGSTAFMANYQMTRVSPTVVHLLETA